MNNYKVLQMTNNVVGAVNTNAFMPYGVITRRIQNTCSTPTFTTSTAGIDTIYINEAGNYNITYSASITAPAAGTVSVALIVNGIQVYSVGAAADAGSTVNLTLPYQIRVCPNGNTSTNIPASVQIKLVGVAIASGVSNILIEKIH